MDLRDLELFVAVVEEGGFRRAAERSFITQPALTRRITALEDDLGAPLLVRDARGARPTEAGRALLGQARATLRSAQECRDAVARVTGRVEVLRLGLVSIATPPLVTAVLARFAAEHPQVRVVERDLPPREQVRDLRDGRLDVGVLGRPADTRGLRFVRLLDAGWTAVVPGGHPLAAQAAVDVSELRAERLVLFPRFANPPLYDHVLRALSDADGRARVVHEPAQRHAALDLVRAGAGIMPTPFVLGDDLAAGVRQVPLRGLGDGVPFGVACSAHGATPMIRSFIAIARSQARRGGGAAPVTGVDPVPGQA